MKQQRYKGVNAVNQVCLSSSFSKGRGERLKRFEGRRLLAVEFAKYMVSSGKHKKILDSIRKIDSKALNHINTNSITDGSLNYSQNMWGNRQYEAGKTCSNNANVYNGSQSMRGNFRQAQNYRDTKISHGFQQPHDISTNNHFRSDMNRNGVSCSKESVIKRQLSGGQNGQWSDDHKWREWEKVVAVMTNSKISNEDHMEWEIEDNDDRFDPAVLKMLDKLEIEPQETIKQLQNPAKPKGSEKYGIEKLTQVNSGWGDVDGKQRNEYNDGTSSWDSMGQTDMGQTDKGSGWGSSGSHVEQGSGWKSPGRYVQEGSGWSCTR